MYIVYYGTELKAAFAGLLHRGEERSSNGGGVFRGGAPQSGHADHCESEGGEHRRYQNIVQHYISIIVQQTA